MLATWLCRGVTCLADPAPKPSTIRKHLASAKANVIFCVKENLQAYLDVAREMGKQDLPIIVLGDHDLTAFGASVYGYADLLRVSTQYEEVPLPSKAVFQRPNTEPARCKPPEMPSTVTVLPKP